MYTLYIVLPPTIYPFISVPLSSLDLADISIMFIQLRAEVSPVQLSCEHRVTVDQYAAIWRSDHHILLDVRSAIQFNLISLSAENECQVVISIPLKTLETMSFEDIRLKLHYCTTDKDKYIYTLCRRGVDSVSAAKYLLGAGFSLVKNIDGGLTSWQQAVDPDFPIY